VATRSVDGGIPLSLVSTYITIALITLPLSEFLPDHINQKHQNPEQSSRNKILRPDREAQIVVHQPAYINIQREKNNAEYP
jgi:hypothetical protein